MKEWNIQINYGIKTGYNEAFIIDGNKRRELIEKCPEADSLIRPILRGRDIQKYKANWQNLYIIGTFPSLKIDIENYPSIKSHLLSFGFDRLKQTGELGARKKTNNQWFEIQDSINYWEDFFRPKIVWGEISDKSKFAYDSDNIYTEATTFLMTGNNLKYLLAMLNSKLLEWYFNQIGTATGVGTNRWKKYTIELLPIIVPNKDTIELIENHINSIIINKNFGKSIEEVLNNIVFELYGLSQEESLYINNTSN